MCLGMPGRIIRHVDSEHGLASAEVNGAVRTVNLQLLADEGPLPGPGEWVLVHMGFAMASLGEQEAAEALQLLEELQRSPEP